MASRTLWFWMAQVISYQCMLDTLDYTEAVEGIRRGLEDVEAGRTRPASEFFEESFMSRATP
jgi:predicted transcriptional regulator